MYKELTIIFKNNPDSDDEFDGGTYSITYEKAAFQISGDYMVLHLQKEDEYGNGFVQGHVLPIKSIKSYKGI
jgi:hypothetical protein